MKNLSVISLLAEDYSNGIRKISNSSVRVVEKEFDIMKQGNNNNYKEIFIERVMRKRGQMTIFVIVAILIVAVGILIYFFRSDIGVLISGEIVPNTFLGECIESTVDDGINLLSEQGGYADPEGFVLYGGKKIKYLCYNSEYYQTCLVQQPLILEHFENELADMVSARADVCVVELKQAFESKGYSVSGVEVAETTVEIVPGKIRVNIDAPMTVTKDETQTFESYRKEVPGNMYDLLMISTSIVDYESTYGDAPTDLYYDFYPTLLIEKLKLGDGSTIYTVRDVTTKDKFVFASRSVAWPGGFGLEG
jgi:hypothetical protein